MSLCPECISTLLADKDHADFSLEVWKKPVGQLSEKLSSGLLKGQFDSQTNFELIKTMFMLN